MKALGNIFCLFGFVIVLFAVFTGADLLYYLCGMTIILHGTLNITDANGNDLKMEINKLETKISRLECKSS